jgi:hypothetical protein
VLKLGSALLQVILLSMAYHLRSKEKGVHARHHMTQRSIFGKKISI